MEPNTTHSTDLYSSAKQIKKPIDSSIPDQHTLGLNKAGRVWEVIAKLSLILPQGTPPTPSNSSLVRH